MKALNSCQDRESVSASVGFPLIIPERGIMTTENFVGIDVSKESLEVAIYGQETIHSYANTPAGQAELVDCLKPLNPTLIVVLEASGGYEIEPALTLMADGLPVAVGEPAAGRRNFARAYGVWPKLILSMPTCWPTLLKLCDHGCVPCKVNKKPI